MSEAASRFPAGCTLRPERAAFCGLEHRLVESPRGHRYWCDALFLDLLAAAAGEGADADSLAARHGLPRRILDAALPAVRELFSAQAPPPPPAPAAAKRTGGPLVSIVVVNLDGERHLPSLLASVESQTHGNLETVVVENGSRDGSLRILSSRPGVRVLPQGENLGFCRGNNLGISAARGEVLLLLNNDTVLDPRCVERAVACLAEAPADTLGVFPKIVFQHAPRVINCAGVQWHRRHLWRDNTVGMLDLGGFGRREQVFGGIFAAVFLRRTAFERLGLFDERFFTYGEDFDVCYRANLAGYRFILEPGAVVRHAYRASSREDTDLSFTLFRFLRNYPLVILKNYELRNVLPALGYFRAEFWAPWARRARREPGVRRLLRRVLRDLVVMAPHILRERRRIGRMRRVRDREIWVRDELDSFNIFHYDGMVALNRINLEASVLGNARYGAGGAGYAVFGASARIPARGEGAPAAGGERAHPGRTADSSVR